MRAVRFKEGDAVKKGDVLVELDSRDIEAAKSAALGKVTAARAAAEDAAEDFEKYSALYKDGLISNNQWRKVTLKNEGAKSDLRQAEAVLTLARTQSDYLTIRAEKDAHVAAVIKHEGDLTLPGLSILMLDWCRCRPASNVLIHHRTACPAVIWHGLCLTGILPCVPVSSDE